MTATTHLGITLVEQSQAQKEVTVNEAFTRIDAVLNNGAISRTVDTPPGAPTAGDLYIVGPSPTGAWAGKAKQLAYYDQIWRFIEPHEGAMIWVNDEDFLYSFDGTDWATPTVAASVSNNSVTNAKLAQMEANTIKMNNTGGTANAVDGTVAQALAMLGLPFTRGTPQNSTSGTEVSFTGIPSGVNKIWMIFEGVSSSGNSVPIIQLGDSGGFENSGYSGSVSNLPGGSSPATANHNSGFHIAAGWGATSVANGFVELIRYYGNYWAASGTLGRSDNTTTLTLGGVKQLSDTLTSVRLTTVGGSDSFDAGRIQICYI